MSRRVEGRGAPSQLAAFDQAHASCADIIDALIETHAAGVTGDGHREVRTVGLAMALLTSVTHKTCAELLAVAIDRLALGGPNV